MKLVMKTDEEKNYCGLKESIRMMKSQRSDIEKNNLIEEGERKTIDKIIRQHEIINCNLKSQV